MIGNHGELSHGSYFGDLLSKLSFLPEHDNIDAFVADEIFRDVLVIKHTEMEC